jgi:hypothetical protein
MTTEQHTDVEQGVSQACVDVENQALNTDSFDPATIPAISVDRMPNNDEEEEAVYRRQQRDLDNASRQEDISLKKRYGNGLLIALAIQLLIMNGIFFSVGFSWLKYEQWALHLYVSGTLIEIFALVLVVTKYLFPPSKGDEPKQ